LNTCKVTQTVNKTRQTKEEAKRFKKLEKKIDDITIFPAGKGRSVEEF